MNTKFIKTVLASTVLAACICTIFVSCSKNEQSVNDQLSVKTDSKASEPKKSSIKRNKEPDEFGIIVSDKIFEADIFSKKLQLGNSVFTFPKIPVSELLAANASFDRIDPEKLIVKSGDSRNSDIIIDGKTYSFRFVNYTDEDQLLKDCVAECTQNWIIDDYDLRKGQDYICPKGIRIGSTLDELLAAYGDPTYKDENIYYYIEDLVSCPAVGFSDNFIYEENGVKWYDIQNHRIAFGIDSETNTVAEILFVCPEEFVSEKSIDEIDKVSSKKAHFTAHEAFPEYFKQASDFSYCVVENNDKTILFRANYFLSNAYMFKTDLTEYTDESLAHFFEEICNGYAPDRDTVSYDYRINGKTAYLYFYTLKNNKNNDYGNNGEVTIYYLNEDFDTMKWINISLFPCNGETDFTFDDFDAVRYVIDEMADSMELKIEYLE